MEDPRPLSYRQSVSADSDSRSAISPKNPEQSIPTNHLSRPPNPDHLTQPPYPNNLTLTLTT